jgi:hypothetical protein
MMAALVRTEVRLQMLLCFFFVEVLQDVSAGMACDRSLMRLWMSGVRAGFVLALAVVICALSAVGEARAVMWRATAAGQLSLRLLRLESGR